MRDSAIPSSAYERHNRTVRPGRARREARCLARARLAIQVAPKSSGSVAANTEMARRPKGLRRSTGTGIGIGIGGQGCRVYAETFQGRDPDYGYFDVILSAAGASAAQAETPRGVGSSS